MTSAPGLTVLSADQARRLALWSQGLIGSAARRTDAAGVLRRLGAVQLDTISVLARNHELVPYARLGPIGREAVEGAFWSRPGRSFEYWAHAACILPIEDWPWYAFRRRAWIKRLSGLSGLGALQAAEQEVLSRLRDLGPVTTAELGGSKAGGTWWSWSPLKRAVELLLSAGRVVCIERRGWRRVYDLTERAVPAHLLDVDPPDADCLRHLVAAAGARLGVATVADLADYHRLTGRQVSSVLADSGLVPVSVKGWDRSAWADPAALADLDAGRIRGAHRTTLLSPFDSVVWDRARTERLFAFTHRLEAYVPAAQRVHGYFAMPLLAGGRLVGRVDPAREGKAANPSDPLRLVARRVSLLDPAAVEPAAAALREAAAWVGAGAVSVADGAVSPPALARPLARALRA